ncbi:MAG: tRNA lysidine(34) synthetase TilS [Acidobacteriia bacterium]|nr:tRNA lysidine(34) synthetase TilS [Terriglobia bacterium]
MGSIHEKILRTITSHRMFAGGERVAVAVSGGPDSVALLVLLCQLATRFSLTLLVAHYNHQLRGEESDGDEQFVLQLSEKLGLKCIVGSENVHQLAVTSHRNEEAVARECRYQFLKGLSRSEQVEKVALGHTANDQAETFLMRLFRGAGMRGLGSIHPMREGYFVRPLLEITREEVEDFLEEGHLAWRQDSTNRDLRRTRNRIRHELLPLLAENYNSAIVQRLAHTAAQCREEESFLAGIAQDWFEQFHLRVERSEGFGDSVALPTPPLTQLGSPIRRRVIRLAVEAVKGNLLGIDEDHVASIQRLIDVGQSGDLLDLPSGIRVERVFERLHFFSEDPAGRPEYEVVLPVPGSVQIPYRGLVWTSRLIDRAMWRAEEHKEFACGTGNRAGEDGQLPTTACFDYSKISLCLNPAGSGKLIVRNLQPGDRYQPRGSGHVVKVHDLLSACQIAARERTRWPLLIAGDDVVWARGCAESECVAVADSSRQILMITEEHQRGE